ncbi:MAG: hypothetical protein ACP5P3_05170 [Ignavibacteria bacterium]
MRLLYTVFVLLVTLFFFSCSDPITGVKENQPPQTYLTLFPDSIIAPGSTLKKISWWGDDPDGFVVGFYFSFDSTQPISNWTYTTNNDSTFFLPMNGTDTTFRFYVAAVDDKGLIDPTPASNLFPTINTPPTMQFVSGTDIPDTIFPVASFSYVANDPDGISTIKYFYWSLNDTLHFHKISAATTVLTLNADSGLVINSNNSLYMKVQDAAGAYSRVVRMPSDTNKFFYVRKVNARVLLIKDMPIYEMAAAGGFFYAAMDTVKYDTLDIKSGNGKFIPKLVNPMFIETLKLFRVVIWSADRGNSTQDNANFDLAQRSIPFYTQSGGKVLFTTGFPNVETQTQGQLINFAPVDSISTCTIALLASNVNLINVNASYPVLRTNTLIQRVRGLKVTTNIPIIYKLPYSSICNDSITVCIKDKVSNPGIVLFGLPIYFLNGDPIAAKEFIRKVLFDEFGL